MTVSFSFSLGVTECAFENQVVDQMITGHVFSSPLTVTLDGQLIPIQIQSDGFYMIDLSTTTLSNGIHPLIFHTSSEDCKAFLLVFNGKKVLVTTMSCESLVLFLKDQSIDIIGMVIGFIVKFNALESPCSCVKLLMSFLGFKNIGILYGHALKVMEFYKIKFFKTRSSFDEDIMCLGIRRDFLSTMYCQLIDVLNFPKTQDATFQFQDTVKIDLSKLVTNHEEGFVYEIASQNVKGTIKLEGHNLLYIPPVLSIFSVHLVEEVVYQVTSLEGRVNLGKIMIKAIA